MRSWPRLTALVVLMALSGCAGEAEAPRTGQVSSSREDPQRILAGAVAAIREEPATGFRSTVTVQDHELLRTEGFAVVDAGWEATTTLTEPGSSGPRVMLTKAAEGSVWMQMTDWKGDDAGCWLGMSPDQVPFGVSALTPHEPQFFALLPGLEAVDRAGSDPDVLTARLGTLSVGVLLTVKLQEALGLATPDGVDAPVDVTVTVDDGRLRRLTVEGADLVAALDRAGEAPDGRMSAALEEFRVELEFTDAGADTEVSAPPERLRTQVGDDSAGCR